MPNIMGAYVIVLYDFCKGNPAGSNITKIIRLSYLRKLCLFNKKIRKL
jgi:hypothetical protein